MSYFVQVTDTKENLASGSPRDVQQNAKNDAESQSDKEAASKAESQNASGAATNNAGLAANGTNNSTLRPDRQTHLAMASKPSAPSDARPPGSQPPPNDMSKRVLDAGQCSSCQPMRILVDEWGRSFEGQLREKLEIAIDPTLKLLDELLEKSEHYDRFHSRSGKI